VFTPTRRATPEWLDDPSLDRATAVTSGEDIARCNAWLGGRRALRAQFAPLWDLLPTPATVLDVACGVGDLGAALQHEATRRGRTLHVIALDRRAELVDRAQARGVTPLVADVATIPLRDASVDVVICGQFLHHLAPSALTPTLRELSRVARHAVLISDLERSWVAAAGFWLLAWPLALHPVSRHDGVASVLKGFTAEEFRTALTAGLGRPVRVRRRLPFRLTSSWGPSLP